MNKNIIHGIIIVVIAITIVYFLSNNTRENYGSLVEPLSLMFWNPHYECFNNKCCGSIANKFILDNITSRKVDFSTLALFRFPDFKLPPGYKSMYHRCGNPKGGDQCLLIYNSEKWTPIGKTYTFCLPGRPTIIQQFVSNTSSFILYVIGSHFTHDREQYVRDIAKAIASVGIKADDNVVFMGDTNQNGSSEKLMREMLGKKSPSILSSTESGTCCYGNIHSKFGLKYDRIIATSFGKNIKTDITKYREIIKNPIEGCDYNKMHLPVFSVIS